MDTSKNKFKSILFKILKVLFISIIILLMYSPIIIIAIISIDSDGTASTFSGFSLEWYDKLFSDKELFYDSILKNTILVAVISTICSTIIGTITAIGINSLSKKNKQRMIMLNNVPVLNADIATAVLLFLIFQAIGIVLQIDSTNRLNYFTLIISHIFFSTPYVILSVLPKLGEIDKNLYDAALDLGCKPRKAIRKVIIPAIATGVLTGAMLAFTMSIDDFAISYFVGGSNANNFSCWYYARRRSSKQHSMQVACAYNTLITVITIISLVAYNIIKLRKKKRDMRTK